MSDMEPISGPPPLSPTEVPSSTRPARASFWLLAAGLLAVLHLLWVGAYLAPAIMSPDANGYVVQARLIAEEGRTSFSTGSPVQYVGMHWLETEGGVFHSRYPAGLPLLFAAAWKIGGLNAALWINPLLASATVLLVFFLARRFASGAYALLAAAVVASVPVTNQHALDADAHVAAAFFLVGGVLALLRFGDTRATLAGLVAGGLLGAVPTVRYPEAIVGLAIGAWLLWRVRPIWRAWPAVLGALLPIGALCVHNTAAYGAFWRTGYSLTNEQTGFGLSYLAAHAIPYLQALGGQSIFLMFAFGAAGLAALLVDPRRRGEGGLFTGIAVPLVLVYMAYYFGGGGPGGAGGNMRFLIPTFPFFAVAGVWLLARVAEHLGAAGRAAVGVVAVLQLVVGLGSSVQTLASANTSLATAARARTVAEKEVPAGSVLIVDRQMAESLDATGRWKLVEESMVAGFGGPGGTGMGGPVFPGGAGFPGGPGGRGGALSPMPGGPGGSDPSMAGDDPSPMQRGKNRAQQERYAGLRPDERRVRVWADLKAWAGGRPVYWFARSLDAVDNALPDGADYRSIAEVDAPSMIGPGGGGGGQMPGMPGRGGKVGSGRGLAGAGSRGFMPPGGAGPMGGPGWVGGPGGTPDGRRSGNTSGAGAKLRVVRIVWPKS
jgi:hypothetical protein